MASTAEGTEEGVRRRDWIHIAAVSTAGVGGASVLYPLISQMAPTADVLAASTTDVDVSSLEPGQSIKAVFREQPLFVKRLTPEEIAEVTAIDAGGLRDPQTLEDRLGAGNEDILVNLGVCTHLGCVPLGAADGENKGEFDGYFCPCHGSHYDALGRIRKGPAPTNLEVPEFTFTTETTIRVG
ncbi:ubiquinol-cytochrome c reductase iron-sulfur subunit [Erythrobacter sp. KY5]|uniref:ubiquinol-cytochrome c reductase iron-sulfur subunit n=1 Tax=Erythrobacter sp. KY5 TaxID=2011159 RepID=UPI000DBF1455|nr:ubiquinol-cytochrome c reductase iron-sulfur subunit [Erythrobacter sp. KY5]AWW73097.1 ubiquinol-cytochrome c reductase iron-sulfur subunit [Erythrobacter sp. KY5]